MLLKKGSKRRLLTALGAVEKLAFSLRFRRCVLIPSQITSMCAAPACFPCDAAP